MADLASAYGSLGDEWSDIGELLELLAQRPAWHADAACREHPEVTFFPQSGEDPRPAQQVCAGCLVRDDCRAWALDQSPYLQGIWAGLSWKTRKRLRLGAA